MKKTLLLFFLLSTGFVFSQNKSFWQKQTVKSKATITASKLKLPQEQVYSLDIVALKQALDSAPKRESYIGTSQVIISFPNSEGEFERFSIKEASVMHPDLEARYPGIKSYAGQGVDDPSARIRFSISPLGLESMRLSANKPATFIEPLTNDLQQYTVFKRSDVTADFGDFECTVTDNLNTRLLADGNVAMRNADDATLRTYRLAMSATGEFTSYHGGTKALALAAINNTMTRVNGVFENDFNVTMVLIANTDAVIYTNSGSDPYGNSTSGYNSQLQSTLTSVIGESNYDIGHLVANLQNNGNAGCIGCVCVNGQKGSGWTSYTTPSGVNFDIDYVAHEMGHQFGGNHTFTFSNEGGTGAQMEPGSGSTIMGYAGITGSTDVQAHSDPYFHARTIEQITNYVKSTSCQTNTNTGNAVPSVNAGSNYTIPKGTAFVLDGTATDANSGDVLTYCWEQYNTGSSSTTNPSVNATSGPAFRSYIPTTDSKRYFPRLSTIKSGATSWQWEAVPNVGRTLNFRLTVRDNRAGGANNNSDDMVVTVNGTAGPFVVNSPNTNVTWNAGTTQNVTWNVAGTTGNGVNAANVDIFLSTDGGDTYPIALATGVPNDGSQDIVVPNSQGSQNRIMVRGSNNIFFDISNSNFTISGQVVCNANVPTGLAASNVGSNSATISWSAVSGATYDLRYRTVGSSTWTTNAVSGISSGLSGLSTLTQYEVQVRSKCSGGSNSAYSSSVNFTTTDVQLNYCTSASTNINDEYIGRVQLNTINNASGGQFYSDFTGISTTLTKDSQYTITVTPTWTGTVYSEGYSVWIDYNRDGDFDDSGEQVWSQNATQNTPVSGNFTIPSEAVENSTRMRVSMKYNGVPTSCETFQYGEVEDYTIVIEGSGPDTTPPVITLNGAATINLNIGDTYTELGATATDNIDGDLTSSIIISGTVNTASVGAYLVTYNVSDTAGNNANEVTRTVNVNPDTTAPVISLIGASIINLTVGDAYNELGATATDNIDGDLTSSIVISGTVNTASAGAYLITYNVSDAAGNAATQLTRTINVSEPSSGCSGGITSFPYTEGFENTLGTWTQSSADDIDWTVDASGTPSSNTGPSSASEGSYYIYVEASSPNYPSKRAILNSPCFDLTSVTLPTFDFDYHMYGATDMGTIDLEASTDEGNSWTSIWSESGNKGNSWLSASINLNAYAGGTVQLRFNRNVGSTWQADIAIDNIKLSGAAGPDTQNPTPASLSASNITETTTDLSWSGATDNISVSDYDLYQNGGFIANLSGSSYQATGLTENTSYSFYVIANDAAGNSSVASNTVNVTTLAAPTCNDGIQNGDETGVDCGGTSCVPCSTSDVVLHEGYFETGWDNWADGGNDVARYSGSFSYEGSYSIRIRDNSGTASAMTLSNIDVTPFSQVVVDFYFYVSSMENGEDFWLLFYDGSSWNNVATYVSGSGISNNTFYQGTVTLTQAQYNFATNSGFRFQCDASGNNDQIYIDQVTITGTTSSRGETNQLIAIRTLDIDDEFGNEDILVYPNPVKGNILNVKLPGNEDASYAIINILGQTVSTGNSILHIDVSGLEAGMYFINVNEGEEIITKKFIKQ